MSGWRMRAVVGLSAVLLASGLLTGCFPSAAPDLQVVLAASPNPVPPGGIATWTATVRNVGSTAGIGAAAPLLQFGAPATIGPVATAAPTGYECAVNEVAEVVRVECRRRPDAGSDFIPDAGSRTFTIAAPVPTSPTSLSVSANVDPLGVVSEGNETNNTASLTTQVGTRVVGRVNVTPRHGQAKVGRPATLRVTWTHPESWRLLDAVEVRLTLDGSKVLRARWEEGDDAVRQLEGDVVVLDEDASGAAGQNVRKVRLTLVVDLGSALAGEELVIEALATDDAGVTQDWEPVGTLRVRG